MWQFQEGYLMPWLMLGAAFAVAAGFLFVVNRLLR